MGGIGSGATRSTHIGNVEDVPALDIRFLRRLEPDPKVVEQYQPFMIHASLQRDGVDHDMDCYCPARA